MFYDFFHSADIGCLLVAMLVLKTTTKVTQSRFFSLLSKVCHKIVE